MKTIHKSLLTKKKILTFLGIILLLIILFPIFVIVCFIVSSAIRDYRMHQIVREDIAKYIDKTNQCYTGFVNNEFTENYNSQLGFSFKYPSYFRFVRGSGEKTTEKDQFYLEHKEFGVSLHINVDASPSPFEKEPDFKPHLFGEFNKYIPCEIKNIASYSSNGTTVPFGTLHYGHGINIYTPYSLKTGNYAHIIAFSCNDNDQKICSYLLPQIVSTLKLPANW